MDLLATSSCLNQRKTSRLVKNVPKAAWELIKLKGVLYGGATTGVFSALQAAGAAGVGVALKASAAAIAGSLA